MRDRRIACATMLRYKPPRIAFMLLAVAAVTHLIAPGFWPALPSALAIGGLFAAAGLGVMLRAWWLFRSRGTAIHPTATTRVLITDDIYRLTRNPMYLGMFMLMLAAAMAVGSLPFYVASITLFLIMDYVFCPFEEARLQARFGAAFEEYRGRVRRWL